MARYFRRGVSKFRFLPAVANLDAPTAPEFTAGVDLSPQVATVTGFDYANTPIDTPDFATTFTPQIGGEDKAAQSSLGIYDDDASVTIRTALAKGTAGFMVLEPYGHVSTKRCEVWPSTVISISDVYNTSNAAATFNVMFSITARPHQAAVLP